MIDMEDPVTGFDVRKKIEHDGQIQKASFIQNQQPMSWQQVIDAWRSSYPFREVFLTFLRQAPFVAYRWETPPLITERLTDVFECVLLNSPYLDTKVDMVSFQRQFQKSGDAAGIIDFMNLGSDARLIVPKPVEPVKACAHLASFIREVPENLCHELLATMARIIPQEITDQPRWISTAGGGVAWLHVRIDHRPKYYGYAPYRQFG